MNTKLTLKLDDSLIESAKRYSAQNGKSVSQLVADYFTVIKKEKLKETADYSPTVRKLKGLLENTAIDEVDYHRHIEEKYL